MHVQREWDGNQGRKVEIVEMSNTAENAEESCNGWQEIGSESGSNSNGMKEHIWHRRAVVVAAMSLGDCFGHGKHLHIVLWQTERKN